MQLFMIYFQQKAFGKAPTERYNLMKPIKTVSVI